MSDGSLDKRITQALETDVLRNVIPLKIMRQYGDKLSLYAEFRDDVYGVLIVLPRSDSFFYTQKYPDVSKVIFPLATDASLLPYLYQEIEAEEPFLLAMANDEIVNFARSLFRLDYQRSYISYTRSKPFDDVDEVGVRFDLGIGGERAELCMLNGYSEKEIFQLNSWGAKTFSVYSNTGKLCSCCFVFPNYNDQMWEIAGLRTIKSERSRGHAKRLVKVAINHILNTDQAIFRYQVDAGNIASVQLANSIGLEKYMELKHFKASYLKKK